jgi:IMP dehydrogenase
MLDTHPGIDAQPKTLAQRSRSLEYAYGFDDVALVPDRETLDPALCDISWRIGDLRFDLPILAAAMDGVVDPEFAAHFGEHGGLAVLNLEGIHGRYEDAAAIYEQIASATPQTAVTLLPELYRKPVDAEIVRKAVMRAKATGGAVAVSATPANASWLLEIAIEAGADIVVIQSTVTSTSHVSASGEVFDIAGYCANAKVPVIVGNTAAYEPALELMRAGAAGILVGIGPGAECTSREVLGIGLPQISATLEVAQARDDYERESGRRISVITDGGMRVSGDMVKALAAGADALMLGAPLAQSYESPGRGFNWGMASFHGSLPRGTRISVGTTASLRQILHGPSEVNNGSQNLSGAIRTAMGVLGARTIADMHTTRIVHAPAIKTEGKMYQHAGKL